jgi:hypothetical protein
MEHEGFPINPDSTRETGKQGLQANDGTTTASGLFGDNFAPPRPQPKFPLLVRLFGQFFSYIFHPLFIPVYLTAVLVYIHPYYFVAAEPKGKLLIIIRVFVTLCFFPAFTVLLLKLLGFVDSIFLRTQKERIIPYVATGVFFFWSYFVFRNQPDMPGIMKQLCLGLFLAASSALVANIYIKISMHALAMGGMLTFIIIVAFMGGDVNFGLPIICAVLVAGLVCTARLIVSDHFVYEIYWGFIVGAACQLAAWLLVGS